MNTPVPQAEVNRYWDFAIQQMQPMGHQLPPSGVLWHYTSGDGLVKIIESAELWTTQISCVNDSAELRYGVALVLDALKAQRGQLRVGAPETIVYDAAIAGLEIDAAPQNEWFITSFSEAEDDLSQWRGYGGGEGGYAIGFDAGKLVSVLRATSGAVLHALAPICYDSTIHQNVARSIAAATGQFYLSGLTLSGMAPAQWVPVFLQLWRDVVVYLAPLIKHPAFQSEKEWRIIHSLQSSDVPKLRFQQRQSMLRRHLPLALHSPDTSGLLPITGVVVGPSRHREISRVSVGDLLKKKLYLQSVYDNVTLSKVPFQTF